MTVRDYLRASGWDFLICLVIAVSVGFVNCSAFFVDAGLQFNIGALVASCAVPLVIMFGAAYSRRTVIPGIGVLVVVVVVACVLAGASAQDARLFEDVETNPVPFLLIMFFTTLAAFLLTRRRWLVRVLVAVVTVDVCFVEFVYKGGYWYALIAALVAVGAMVVYRNYRTNLKDAGTGKVSFTAAFGVGAVYAAVLAAVTCLVFFCIIAPLNPPAHELKLFTRYMNYETVEMTGVGDTSTTKNEDNTTNQNNDQIEQTNQQTEEEGQQEQEEDQNLSPLELPNVGSLQTLAQNGLQSLQEMLNYLIENPAYLVLFIVLVLLVLSAPFVIKKRLRARWYAKTCALPPAACAQRFYLFFMRRFKLLKVVKPEELTLVEFAESCNATLGKFAENEARADFKTITAIYCKAAYGHVDPSEEEIECCKAFYRGFYKAFVEASGKLKYAFRFFRV